MKLAKKVLVLVVALAMISTVAISAFAASSLAVSSATTTNGETVTVTATLNGAKGLQSGTFVLTWDPAVIEYVSQASEIKGAIPEGGKLDSGKEATVALMFTNACDEDSITLGTFTFKAIGAAGTKSDVTIAVLDGDIDGIDEPAAATGTVTIEEKKVEPPVEDTTKAPDVTPSTDATTKKADDTTTKKASNGSIPATGDAGIAVAAALVVLAGAAFVASKKSK